MLCKLIASFGLFEKNYIPDAVLCLLAKTYESAMVSRFVELSRNLLSKSIQKIASKNRTVIWTSLVERTLSDVHQDALVLGSNEDTAETRVL